METRKNFDEQHQEHTKSKIQQCDDFLFLLEMNSPDTSKRIDLKTNITEAEDEHEHEMNVMEIVDNEQICQLKNESKQEFEEFIDINRSVPKNSEPELENQVLILIKNDEEQTSRANKSNDKINKKKRMCSKRTVLKESNIKWHTTNDCAKGKNDSNKENQSYNCEFCEKTYSTKFKLKQHLISSCSMKNNTILKPKDTSLKTLINAKKENHTDSERNLPLFSCQFCQKLFHKISQLQIHTNSIHTKEDNPLFKCKFCQKTLAQTRTLLDHINYVHFKKQKPKVNRSLHKCELCERTFIKKSNLVGHINGFHLKKIKCEICNKIFASDVTFQEHQNAFHLKRNEFKCRFCEKKFKWLQSLRKHIKVMHSKETNRKVECKICHKLLKSSYTIKKHLFEVHLKSKGQKHKCEICNRTYHRRTSLLQHIKFVHLRKENDNALFKCEICEIWIKTKQGLQDHIKIKHPENYRVKNIKCDICDKMFYRQHCLVNHKKYLHFRPENKIFKCEICGKTFIRKSNLDQHVNGVHLKKKGPPVECEYCKKSFSRKDNLQSHIKRMHEKK